VGEGGLAAQPLGVLAGGDQQLAGVIVADRQQLQKPGSGSTDQVGQPLVGQGRARPRAAGCAWRRLAALPAGLQRVGQTASSGRNLAQVVTNADAERSSSASRTGLAR
jgi:hypothetical protein